jgi:hypothetical protein
MAWVMLVSDDHGYAEAYNTEAEARQAADAAVETADADAWIVVADQATSAAWVIRQGAVTKKKPRPNRARSG